VEARNAQFLAPKGCCDGDDSHEDKNNCSQGHSSFGERNHPAAVAAMVFAGRRGRRREEGGVLGRDGVVYLPGIEAERRQCKIRV